MMANIALVLIIWINLCAIITIAIVARPNAPWRREPNASHGRYLHGTRYEKGSQPPPEK